MSKIDGAGGVGPGGVSGRPGTDLLEALRSGRIRGEEARMRAATTLLESSFYQELFKSLRATVPEGGLTSGGRAEDVFSSLLDQHVAEVAASRSDRGIGRALYRRFTGGVTSEAE